MLSALGTGGAVIISQYLGHHEPEQAHRSAAQLYTVLGLVSSTIILVFLLAGGLLLRLFYGSIEADVMQMARTYLLFCAVSYPFLGICNAGAALFHARGDSRTSMYTSMVMNLINVVGNALLIYSFHLGVLGAALATLAGRAFAAFYVFSKQQKDPGLRMESFSELHFKGSLARRILAIGVPAGMKNGIFLLANCLQTTGRAGSYGSS